MRATGRAKVDIEFVKTRDQVGELAKLATFLGMDVTVRANTEDDDRGSTAELVGAVDHFLPTLVAGLVAVEAVARDRTMESVLDEVRQRLSDFHVGPLDKKPSDNRPLGSGHVEGQ